MHFYHISLIASYNEICFRQFVEEIKTDILYSIMWKKIL